jgi:hypothetical protein
VTTDQTEALTKEAAYYVFNGDAGYVVIAGDDRQTELLGYSDSGIFPEDGNVPANVKSWLNFYAKEYEKLQNTPESNYYKEFQTRTDNYKQSVSPLLGDIKWHQSEPYNNMCPLDDGKRSATGCVATATAQVMKYHSYPEKGYGSVSYTTEEKKINVSCDLSSMTFDWDNMLPTYTKGNYNETQANAVATLMFACGAAAQMDYTNEESGTSDVWMMYALRENFLYDKDPIRFLERYWFTCPQWLSLVKNELSNGRPILYGGQSSDAGHEFVFDGYDTNSYIHINWGWRGLYNGYFRITSLQPDGVDVGGGNGDNTGYDDYQTMIIGIQKPATSTSKTPPTLSNKKIVPSKTTVSLGTKFDVTLEELLNNGDTFTGELGLLLVDSNDSVTMLSAMDMNMAFAAGYNQLDMQGIRIDKSTAAGVYTLCLGAKRDGDDKWTMAYTDRSNTGRLKAVVSDGEVTFSNYWGSFNAKVTEYSFSNDFYVGLKNKLTVTIDNSARQDIYTIARLGLTPEDGGDPTTIRLGALYTTEDETQKTTTYEFNIPNNMKAGKYRAVPLCNWGGTNIEIGEATTIELKSAQSVSSDKDLIRFITYPTVDKSTCASGDVIKMTGKIELTDKTKTYNDKWMWKISPYSSNDSLYSKSSTVFIERDATFDLNLNITPELPEGKYRITPFSKTNKEQILDNQYCPVFTISSQATGIDDTSAEANSLIVYPQPVEETLNMRSPAEAQSVDIYDISGRRVVSQPLTGGRTHSVGVGSLTAGTYIINVNCGGKIYKEKFVKR